jgi:hypothetical protein
MSKKSKVVLATIVLLSIVVLACSISYSPKEDGGEGFHAEDSAGEQQESQNGFELPSILESEPEPPLGLNEGLTSLNSYTYSLQIIANGPTAQDRNETKIITSADSVNERTVTRMESFTSSADDPQGSSSSTANYRIGNITCTVDDGGESEAETEDYSPAAKEMLNILSGLWDVHFKTGGAVYANTEMINGVNCDHFTFNVGGLGKTSGAEVTQSTGEYWSAVDGNYLVKYDVVLETRNAPESSSSAEVLRSEVHYLLYDINAALTIELPAQCQ